MILNPIFSGIIELTDEKVNLFTDSMIEDIQDVIKIEYPLVTGFDEGILPPRYKELKEEMKVVIHTYIFENMKVSEEFVPIF
jgi:hypothetical protein